MNEALEAIRAEWRNGGLARCLAGEEPPEYPPIPSSRVVVWREREVRIPWTAAEDAIVRGRYLVEGYTGLLELLPKRSKDAIKSRAAALGVQAKRPGARPRKARA